MDKQYHAQKLKMKNSEVGVSIDKSKLEYIPTDVDCRQNEITSMCSDMFFTPIFWAPSGCNLRYMSGMCKSDPPLDQKHSSHTAGKYGLYMHFAGTATTTAVGAHHRLNNHCFNSCIFFVELSMTYSANMQRWPDAGPMLGLWWLAVP